ncbi:hypothetical protein J6590_106634, partial [Homalodisca vitripennis]
MIVSSAGFSTTSVLGEISSAPPNCNSITYEKRLPAPLFVRRPWAVAQPRPTITSLLI